MASKPLRVLNAIKVGLSVEGAALVDRSTPFGNPFLIGRDGTREDCVAKFDKWIRRPSQIGLRSKGYNELRGKNLICWCDVPKQRCHASVWLKIANE